MSQTVGQGNTGPEHQVVRMENLERATLRLSEQVSGLNSALLAVGEISQRQASIEHEQQQLAAVVVPREEVEARANALAEQVERYRRKLFARLIAGLVLAAAVVAGLTVMALTYVDHTRQVSYAQCQETQNYRDRTHDYYVAVRQSSTNPVLVAAANKALSGYSRLDCGALR